MSDSKGNGTPVWQADGDRHGDFSVMDGDHRLVGLQRWLSDRLGGSFTLRTASEDASFRRYFRVAKTDRSQPQTWIAMDAPPEQEECGAFVRIADAMRKAGLNTPEIVASDLRQGFLLLTDFGDSPYLKMLDDRNVDQLYGDALAALLRLQSADWHDLGLPRYDVTLLAAEMALFRDWFLDRHLGLTLSRPERGILDGVTNLLIDNALEQPQTWVHRDYHSRNLMVREQDNPGVLDFQDAVVGPVTYDLVSLLRDCYIVWPPERVEGWVLGYLQRLRAQGLCGTEVRSERFLRWFDGMGAQRHMKAIGIFARLCYRDRKPAYLRDVPRSLGYLLAETSGCPELRQFHALLRSRVVPELPL